MAFFDAAAAKVLSRGADAHDGHTEGGTVTGEIQMSRELLRKALPMAVVDSYRTGYLSINPLQWESLAAASYRFNSRSCSTRASWARNWKWSARCWTTRADASGSGT